MRIRVLGKDGVEMVEASSLTLIEHETVISHWEAVFSHLHSAGRLTDAEYARRQEMCARNRERLFNGEIPYRTEGA